MWKCISLAWDWKYSCNNMNLPGSFSCRLALPDQSELEHVNNRIYKHINFFARAEKSSIE